jgi:hypothetical protein
VDFTTGGKPILWSEFGQSVWDSAAKGPSEKLIQKQGEYHELFYRMVLDADADGTAPWWWPGGYRVNERSDFGILNPDGTFRPSANLIRKYAPLMKRQRRLPEAEELFIADRDAHPGGYWHLTFNEGKEAYQKAREAGKTLRVASQGTGTDSCTVFLAGVGNVPFAADQPLKVLNAEFNVVWVLDVQGQWAEVKSGDTVSVKANAPVMARVSVGNTGEAEWVAPGSNPSRSGTVYLGCVIDSPALTALPANTGYLADAMIEEFALTAGISTKTRVSLRMTAKDRAWFGQRMEFELDPR